ncbi:MAG: hypothetical protein HOH43_06315, partial [Candidatus Latescibacteria bacterium]|nr:hypothetical protein [Candidatus Latescibacterota bacterium]
MKFKLLSQAQRHHFQKEGYLIVPGTLDQAKIDQLVEATDRFMATQDAPVRYYANRYIDMLFDPILLPLITNEHILPLVMQLMSYDLHLMRTHLIYKYPQESSYEPIYPDGDGRSFRNWHRDLNNFAPDHPIRGTVAIRVGYALTDCAVANSGATLLVPGSHRLTEQLRFGKDELDPPEFVEPSLRAGDAYIFSTSTYHTPAVNFTQDVAKVMLVSYAYSWWAQQHPIPDQAVLDAMDPLAAQLMGAGKEGEDNPL